MIALERRYRRLLRAFPTEYRNVREEELVGTLLDAAGEGRRWPTPREAWDLLRSGLRTRWRVGTGGSLGRTVGDGLRWGAFAWLIWKAARGVTEAFFAVRWGVVAATPWDEQAVPLLLFLAWPITLVFVVAARHAWSTAALLATVAATAAGETWRALSYGGPVRPLWVAWFVLPQFLPVLALLLPARAGPRPARARRVGGVLAIVALLAAARLTLHFAAGGHDPFLAYEHGWRDLLPVALGAAGLLAAWFDPRWAFAVWLLAANAGLRTVLSELQWTASFNLILRGTLPAVLIFACGLLAVWWARRRTAA